MPTSALSSAVSSLVRASMGASVDSNVADEDLDRHVAELILQEAKQKEEKYGTVGMRAYLPATFPETTVPKANKRFLSNVIRNTDEHNKSLLKAQALAAEEIQLRQAEEERKDRRRRAAEAASSRDTHRRSDDRHRHRSSRSKRKDRSWERISDGGETEHRSRRRHLKDRSAPSYLSDDPSGDRDRYEHHSESSHSSRRHDRSRRRHSRESSRHRRRRKSGSRLKQTSNMSEANNDESDDNNNDNHNNLTRRKVHTPVLPTLLDATAAPIQTPSPEHDPTTSKTKFKPITRPRSPTPPPIASGSGSTPSLSHNMSRSPSPASKFSSKMDKYFKTGYDPRMDSAPLSKKVKVPREGLIPAEEFEGWDTMLELIKVRQQDKEERKRLEKLSGADIKKKKRRKGEKGVELAWEAVEKKRQALDEQEPSMMDIRYSGKGSVREWDMGKVDVELL